MGNESSQLATARVTEVSHFPDLNESLGALRSSTSDGDDFHVVDLASSGASDASDDVPWYKVNQTSVILPPPRKEETIPPEITPPSSPPSPPPPPPMEPSPSPPGSPPSELSRSSWWSWSWSSGEEPRREPTPPPKSEREIALEHQLDLLQRQMNVLHLKWEQAMSRPVVVSHALPPAQNPGACAPPFVAPGSSLPGPSMIYSTPAPVGTGENLVGAPSVEVAPPHGDDKTPSPRTPVVNSSVSPIPESAAPPPPPPPVPVPPPGPPPPPPPSLDTPPPPPGGARVVKKKKAPKSLTPQEIERKLTELLQASDVQPSNQAIAHKNFLDAFSMQGGQQILGKMIEQYHFLIKKHPLNPLRCFQTMLRWEKGLFASLSKAEAAKLRQDKWYEIANLEEEEQIQQQIQKIKQVLEQRKKAQEERKKAAAASAQRSNMIEELKHKQQSIRQASQQEQAQTELESLNKSQISLTDSEMFLSFCDED